jgi:Flp pilus assembly protein TadG
VTAVEFALILPLLVTLVLGCVDFGRCAYTFIGVRNAARAGAAYAIMNPYTSSTQNDWMAQTESAAREEMTNMTGYTAGNLAVVTTPTIDTDGLRWVRVEATYTSFQTIIPLPLLPNNVVLRSAVEMRMIR